MNYNQTCLIIILCLVNTQIATSAETYLLRNQFQAGKTAYMILDTTTEGVTTLGEKQIPIREGMHVIFSFTTVQVEKPDTATINMGIEKMAKITGTPGMLREEDLKKSFKLEDEKVTLKIDSLGHVVKSLQTSPSQPPLIPGGQNSAEKLPWLRLPEKAVAVGETWNDSSNIPVPGITKPIIMHTTYTLAGVTEKEGKKIARIETQSSIQEKDVKVDPAGIGQNLGNIKISFSFKEYSATGKGVIEFDLTQGEIVSIQDSANMKMDIAGDTSVNDTSFPNKYIHEFKIITIGRCTEKMPEELKAQEEKK